MSTPGPLVAGVITLAVEVPCVAALYRGQRGRMALAALLANSATNLPMNLLLPRWLGVGNRFLVTGEIAALLLETTFYFAAAQPRDLVRAVTASALANGLSFGVGLALWGAAF